MNKKTLIGTGIFAIVAALVFTVFSNNVSQAGPKLSHEEVKSLVTAQYPGTIIELELDREDKKPVYEIEILNGETEYELEVDANTGEILKLKERRVSYVHNVDNNKNTDDDDEKVVQKEKAEENKSQETKREENNNGTTKIVVQEPQEQVKKQVKQTQSQKQESSQATQTKPKAEQPKKVEKQEQKQTTQAKATEKQQSQTKQQTQKKEQKQEKKQTIISRQQAINIALSKFSGKVEDVELDDDDGRLIYEIEIENGDKEAEFEIDAITGKILSIEYDD